MRNIGDTYPRSVAVVFVFNLIFGSGALLLPYAFYQVGYILGTVLFFLLSFLSFTTCTYVIESMSLACAVDAFTKSNSYEDDLEKEAQVNLLEERSVIGTREIFEIKKKFELSDMAKLFFNQGLLAFFFICTILYLYGDLLIYLSIIGSTLRKVTCIKVRNISTPVTDFCEKVGPKNVFRIYISGFTLIVGSLIFFNVSKTKFLQYLTIALRWSAFSIMITIAVMKIVYGTEAHPHPANFSNLPLFIGTCLYSFMCQHSIPSIVFPIRQVNKKYIHVFVTSMCAVLVMYLLISYTGVFAFSLKEMEPVYTMNFFIVDKGVLYLVIGYYLQLFPVIALTSSYPIVGITLRENIIALLNKQISDNSRFRLFITRFIIPMLVVYPPYIFIMFMDDKVSIITAVVGSYAGNLVQYVIPTLLLLFGQRKARSLIGEKLVNQNFQKSPLGNIYMMSFMLIWSAVSMGIVTYFNIKSFTGGKL